MPDSIPGKQSWPSHRHPSRVGPKRSRRAGEPEGRESPLQDSPVHTPRPKSGAPLSPLTRLWPSGQALHLGARLQPSPLPFFRSGPSPQQPCPQPALPTPSPPIPAPSSDLLPPPPTPFPPTPQWGGGPGGRAPSPARLRQRRRRLCLCLGVGAKGATGFGDVLAPTDGGVVGVGSWAHVGRNGGGPYPQHPPSLPAR